MSAHDSNNSPVLVDSIPLGDHDGMATAGGQVSGGELLTLSLDDLIPDARGEVVILSDAGHEIVVVTGEPIAQQGFQPSHIMESGHDVSGFAYCTFASGITLFYPASQQLFITDEG